MSHPAQLPPRCPLQNRSSATHAVDSPSITICRDDEVNVQHHRFPSQGSLFEERPLWLDELLCDSEIIRKGIIHRRSASDSVTISDVSSTFHTFKSPVDEDIPISDGTHCRTPNHTDKIETCVGLEAGCVYGPNSPRRSNLTLSQSSMVFALLEKVPRNPLQCVSAHSLHASENDQSIAKGDIYAAAGDFDSEKASRRHSGQRSRVRKLQYIAELERTVNAFQTMEAELAANVASLYQQRAFLSVENSSLKQRITGLHKEKLIRDGQYLSLKNEVKRLKTACSSHRRSKSASCFQMDHAETDSSETSWQTLGMEKLHLGRNPVS